MAFDPTALAQERTDEGSFERAVLDGLAREIGFDAAFIAVGDRPTTVAIDEAMLGEALATRRYEDEIAPLKRCASRGVVVDTMHATEREVAKRRYHRDFAAPMGGRHTLLAPLIVRDRVLGGLMLGRTGSNFTERALGRLADLLPAIATARASFFAPWSAPALPRPRSLLGALGMAQTHARRGAIAVRDRGAFREMVHRDADEAVVWSRARLNDGRSGWFYVELCLLATTRARHRRSALVLGAGGGVAVRGLAEAHPAIALDVVDRNPAVLELARDWFALGAVPRLVTHVADAIEFVRRAPDARWDVIVVDLYEGVALAPALASSPFFRDLARVMHRGGAIAFNVIDSLDGDVLRRVERAMDGAFDDVRLVPVLDRGEAFDRSARRNVVVLGSRR